MTEYIHHVAWYLQERFDISSNILPYSQPPDIPDKYDIIIFVQNINARIMKKINNANKPKTPTMLPVNNTSFPAPFKTHSARQLQPRPHPMQDLIVIKDSNRQSPVYSECTERAVRYANEAREEHKKRKIFLLNTEQATRNKHITQIVAEINRYQVPVIDYSLENIAILKRRLPATIFIHLPFPFRVKPLIPKPDPVVSLLSSPYRRKVCDSLGVPVVDFFGKWGDVRDQLIQKSKVLVNVHYQPGEYGIFESIRCYDALEHRTLVLSEYSTSTDKVLLKDYIIFATREEMPAKLKDILANYQTYYNQIFNKIKLAEMESLFEVVYRKSIGEIMELPNNITTHLSR